MWYRCSALARVSHAVIALPRQHIQKKIQKITPKIVEYNSHWNSDCHPCTIIDCRSDVVVGYYIGVNIPYGVLEPSTGPRDGRNIVHNLLSIYVWTGYYLGTVGNIVYNVISLYEFSLLCTYGAILFNLYVVIPRTYFVVCTPYAVYCYSVARKLLRIYAVP